VTSNSASESTASTPNNTDWLDEVRWNSDGLVPAIAQDCDSGKILMMAWMDKTALLATSEQGRAIYYSRSRQRLWPKGESSGNVQNVKSIKLDCDADVIVLDIEQIGGIACHTGRESCFYRELVDGTWETKAPVLKDPKEMYS